MEEINIYEAEQKSGMRKVNRSFLAFAIRSFMDEGLIEDLSVDKIKEIVMEIENEYEYEFYVEYLPHKGILEFLDDYDLVTILE